MSDRIEFFISGTPKSWKAPQFNRKTGSVYKGKQEKAWQESIWGQAMPHAPETPWTGPVMMTLIFHMPIPQSWPKWKRELVGRGAWYCDRKPDWTNLAKAFEDALKGVFFVDDSQVVLVCCLKMWHELAGVRVVLKKLPGLPDKKPKGEKDAD